MSRSAESAVVLRAEVRNYPRTKTFTSKDILCLNMVLGNNAILRTHWETLWDGVESYDDLPSGYKMLLPQLIRKVQPLNWSPPWHTIGSTNIEFLAGVPRYAWTKCQKLKRDTKELVAFFSDMKLPFVGMYGLADILSEPETEWNRLNPEIELLVDRKSYLTIKPGLLKSGYQHVKSIPWSIGGQFAGVKRQFIHKTTYTKCHLYVLYTELDPSFRNLYDDVCLHGQPVKQDDICCDNLLIPKIEHRMLFAINRVFEVRNWESDAHLMYIKDALKLFGEMDPGEREELESLLVNDNISASKIARFIESGVVLISWITELIKLESQLRHIGLSGTIESQGKAASGFGSELVPKPGILERLIVAYDHGIMLLKWLKQEAGSG